MREKLWRAVGSGGAGQPHDQLTMACGHDVCVLLVMVRHRQHMMHDA